MSQFHTLEFQISDGIAIIKLNRPDAANGLTVEMAQELMQAAIICDNTDSLRAVLLAANGKMFCAGGDLKTFAAYGDDLSAKMQELMCYMHSAIAKFSHLKAPVIVAVNGMAAGAGFSIAMAGDIVIVGESSKFTMAYTAAGLSPDGSASYYLPRLIGLRRTQQLMLSNRRLTAAEALDWGLVTEVVADAELFDYALAQAKNFAQGPTLAYTSVKKLLANTFSQGLESQMELEAQLMTAMSQSADGKEGIAAFTQKRAPNYQGK
jgi:2-(1,2-epoxy-1,2-dihydrophenyl)acetyl-CoA isomerase